MSIAVYLKDIGRGAAGARSLTREAAQDLMRQVLAGETSAAQTGAFLIAMRMKGETLPELCGFLDAVHTHCTPVPSDRPVVLIPSYNGSRKLPNLTPLLALWLAREGLHVLVHGPVTTVSGRVGSASILHALGLPPVQQTSSIQRAWSRREPAFMPTELLCPALQTLLDYRQALGVRGPGHTVAKMLNPVLGAPALRLVNHTHPEFGALMSAWAETSRADAMLLRGTEGEPVADPRRQPRVDTWLGGRLRPELSLAAHDGVLTEQPLLPRQTDAAHTAVYVQEVLSGMRPVPPPLARQAAQIVAAVALLSRPAAALELRDF